MDYLQSVLQVQVTEATGQNFGTFATVNGVPLAINLVTAADVSSGARRGFGQSCLTESNTVYQARWPSLYLCTKESCPQGMILIRCWNLAAALRSLGRHTSHMRFTRCMHRQAGCLHGLAACRQIPHPCQEHLQIT